MQTIKQWIWNGSILLMICSYAADIMAQSVFTGKSIVPSAAEKSVLDQVFFEQTVFELDVAALKSFVKANAKGCNFDLKIGQSHQWNIDLWENEMRPPHYKAEQTGDSGRTEVLRTECITYAGNIAGSPEQIVRLNIDNERIWGYIKSAKGQYFIEPLNRFVKGAQSKQFIVYNVTNIVPQNIGICGATAEETVSELSKEIVASPEKMTGDDCRKLEVATESDWDLYDYGITFSDILGNLNMVEGLYQSTFNMTFFIVYQHQWTAEPDPYNTDESGCNGWGEMDEFAQYWFNNYGNIRRDINVLYSGKDFNGTTIGCAMTGDFGNNEDNDGWLGTQVWGSYCVNEWIVDPLIPETMRFRLVSHEMGHIFGASHDDSNCGVFLPGNIMCSDIGNATNNFLSTAINEMEADMNLDSAVPNDGRSALRIRVFPTDTNTGNTNFNGTTTYTANQWMMDRQMTIQGSSTTVTFQGTQSVLLQPGFNIVPLSGQNSLKLTIGSCDLNGN